MNDRTLPAAPPAFFSQQVREARRFYLDLAPAREIPLAVVCGGRETCAADYQILRETFPFYSLEFVTRGRGSLVLGARTYPLRPGTVFSYGPGVSQRITTDASDPLVKYFVDFAGPLGRSLLREHDLRPGTVARVHAPGEIQDRFEDLIRDGVQGTALAPMLCTALLQYLILKIADCVMPWQTRPTPAFATYQRCRQHIAEHYQRLRSLGQVAQECHTDCAYLCRLFRRYDHQTPYQFLMRLKMNLAASRLQNPELLVKQVAAELGFDDPFHFSRTFKSVFSVSPNAFRRLR